MKSSIFSQIAELTREHKTAARATAVFLCLALVVTAATVGILTFTGHAMTQQVKVLTCQLTVHEHTPECRDAEGNLVCGYADYVVHIHNDDCYGEDGSLACTLPEIWPHVHTDSCYEEVKTAVCGQEEAQPHAHTEACYDRQQGELICTETEHTHGPECYLREEVLTCDKTEQEHVHNDSCYTTTRDLTCGQEESEEHSHTDECYTETQTLTCDKTTEPHEHGPECYTVNETLICEIPEHVHSDACYNWTETLICQIPEGQIPEGGHVHTDECFETSRELVCDKLENHEHTEECFDHDEAGNRIGNPICGKIELLEHVHGEDCFTIEERTVENAGPFFFETAGEDPEVPAPAYICGKTEHTHDESCLDANGEVICGLEEHVHDDSCLPAAAPEAEAEEAQSSAFVCGKTEHIHDESCLNENGEPVCGLEEHVHDASCVETPENGGAKVFRDANVLITAVYPAEAELPEEATLQAYRLTPESNPADYEEYLEGMKAADSEIDLSAVVLYNIGFYLPDGTEVEPKATVNISIQFLDGSGILSGPVTVVHFADEGTEILESVSDGSSISFDTESFSPFALFLDQVGTVIGLGSDPKTIAATSSNLEDYIGSMNLQQMNPDTGEWEDVPTGGDIVVGNNYRLNVHFEGNNQGGFTNPMTWNLGKDVKCVPRKNAQILDGSTVIGSYDLTEDGELTVTFTDEFLSNSNQVLDMFFDMTVNNTGSSGGADFPWSGHIQQDFKVEKDASLDVEKSAGSYNATDKRLSYTIEATVTKGMVTNGKLSDVMGEGTYFRDYDKGDMHFYDANGNDVSDQSPYKEAIDELTKKLQAMDYDKTDTKPTNFELDLPPMTQGMRFEVTFESFVTDDKAIDPDFVAENMVTYSGENPDGNPVPSDTATAEKPISGDKVTKKGDVENLKVGDDEIPVIKWTVRVGSGTFDPFNVNPLEMEDTLGKGLEFYTGKNIEVTWCDKDGNVYPNGTKQLDWTRDVTLDGKVATYWLRSEYFNGYDWHSGDYIDVVYYTTYDPDKQPTSGFENTIKTNLTVEGTGTNAKVPVGEAIQKTVEDDPANNCIRYTVIADVLPYSHMKSMIGDDEDGHPELDLPYFYIEDRLDFDGYQYFAVNIPRNITVRAEGKTQTYTFTEVPWNSTPGDGIARKTFQVLQGSESNETGGREHRAFRIYFNTARYGAGTEGNLEKHDSIWDIDEATRLIITYDIPYDTPLVDEQGNDTGRTVIDVLGDGRRLDNKALSKRSGSDLEKEVPFEKKTEEGAIDKTAHVVGGGQVEYRVTFKNSHYDATDNDTHRFPQLMNDEWEDGVLKEIVSAANPTLRDSFDERMEYVPGSLYVEVRDSSGHNVYATYEYKGDPVQADGHSLEVSMIDNGTMWVQKSNDGENYKDGEKLKATFNSERTYVFVYKLKLRDEYLKEMKTVEDIENTAKFSYSGKDATDDAKVNIPSDMLQKTMKPVSESMLEYTLNVNSQGLNLVNIETSEGYVNLESYKLVDKMSENLQLTTNGDGSYAVKVEYQDEDGEWKPLEQAANAQGINKEKHNYYLATEEDGSIYFILPDELPIRITYQVLITGVTSSQYLATNEATLYADTKETDNNDRVVDVGESGGSGHSDPAVRIEKKDAETGSLLEGAVFDLYSSAKPEGTSNVETKTVTLDGTNVTMYKVATYTTDSLGAIGKISPVNGAPADALYLLVETTPPAGHIMDATPHFFRFANYGNPVKGGTVEYEKATYQVKPMEANETIIVENPPEAYSLPESGGEGFGPLYAVGIAMMTLSAVLLLEAKQRRRKGEEA